MYCNKCGSKISDGSEFCANCGAKIAPAQPAKQQLPPPYVPPQYQPPQIPLKPQKSVLGRVAVITAAAVAVICAVSYFLFFAPDQEEQNVMLSAEPAAEMKVQPATAKTAEPTVEPTIEPTIEPTVKPAETVSDHTITVSMAYDSGEGIYTGEVDGDGIPHGQGRFTMQTSDTGTNWSYEGQWVRGVITGEGVMTQDDFVFTGSFISGLMDGYCEITDDGILRYAGMCAGGKLQGQGTLYTSSGMLLFEGEFDNDMLVENATSRQARGEAFKPECADMDEMLYDGCMAEDNTFGYPVAVWGFSLAMGEQASSGTIVIGHMGENSYPVCLVYRYGVDEPKMTGDDWINAWGVVAGLYEYVDSDGLTVTCPLIEVVFWNNEQEGL